VLVCSLSGGIRLGWFEAVRDKEEVEEGNEMR
jgi:hypothetical protein